MVSRDEIVNFLNLFKVCLELELYDIKDRKKNLQGLIDLGITLKDRKVILLGLTPEDYHSGPKPDDTDDSKEIREFGTSVGNTEIYIKLRVIEIASKKTFRALVWSFHPAEFPITYPLRRGGK